MNYEIILNMGNCTCWVSPASDISALQNSRKVMESAPLHIPNMHPKLYTLAEKVFANCAETIEKVDLQDREIGEEGGRYLSAILPYLTNLIFLNLEYTNISPATWQHILLSLEDLSTLKHLNLSKNNFTEENAEHLSKGLSTNSDLEALMLESNLISSTGMARLCSSILLMKNLKILVLGCNSLQDSGVMVLANVMTYTREIQFLDLSRNGFTHACTPYLAAFLKGLSMLKVLKIGENLVKDEGFVTLIRAVNENIEELGLDKIGISAAGLGELCERLVGYPKLMYLCLDYNNVNQKTSKMLIDILPSLNLKHLSLVGCDVSSHRKALSLAKTCTEVLI